MQLTPEQLAREKIDQLLVAAGWILQNNTDFNRTAGKGVAVREFQLPNGPCDYLLFVGGKAAGVIEAKKAGSTLSGVAEQSVKYMTKLPEHLARWSDQLIFHCESTGEETFFRDTRDPQARSRRIFAFHKPRTLHAWLREADTLRRRLQIMPPLDSSHLRDCQVDALHGLDASLAKDHPRALIQMATGAGKTFTACTFSWRLLKHARAHRILFLVDRNNLGDQTLKEYQNYDPPGSGRKFNQTYIVQHLHSNHIDPDAKVVITTIQRLYAMLRGEELDESNEEASAFETWTNEEGELRPVTYNPDIPIEHFDFIVTDECHRSIYGLWRQVLEYFDAHLIGLTATPSMHTLGFFNQNLVAEYPYEQSVVDGVNVGFEVYRIRTRVGERGGVVDANYHVPVRDRRTRAIDPRISETVHDPACGTGGFLLAAYDHMKDQSHDRTKQRKLREESLSGVDIVDEVVRLCGMNLYLHGIGNGESPIRSADALATDPGDRYDVILTNPPFGKKSSYKVIGEDGEVDTEREDYEREDFKFTTSNKQFNFLQHIMTIMESDGRAAVVLPDNVLFEAGSAGEGIRKRLLTQFDFHTLMRLPTGIFYKPGVKANVLLFDKHPPRADGKPNTKTLWIYDFRTNMHFTLRKNTLKSRLFRSSLPATQADPRHRPPGCDRDRRRYRQRSGLS